MRLNNYADCLRQAEPRIETRVVRALLMTGTRTMKLIRRYVEYHGPNQAMLNVDGLSIYTKTYVTRDNDQNRQVY